MITWNPLDLVVLIDDVLLDFSDYFTSPLTMNLLICYKRSKLKFFTYLWTQINSYDLQALFKTADRENNLLLQIGQILMADELGRNVFLLEVHAYHVSKLLALGWVLQNLFDGFIF